MRAGAYILGCAGPALGPEERRFFAEAQPFGFILFARNVEDPDQLRRLTGDLRSTLGRDAPILIDQEGGRVQRMGPPHWRQYLPPLDQTQAAGPAAAARAMYLRARLIAAELHAVGIDVNCTPTCDVARPETHPFLRNRCYSDDPDTVARLARAVVDGQTAGGVLSVMKHIPGHGAAQVDSHHDLPQVGLSLDDLRARDFVPFRALNDLPFAMTSHIVYDALDPENPATFSSRVIGMIRGEIGFQGFLMSDDISMQALSGDLAARCTGARAAGCDAVLHCNGDLAEMQVVAGHAGSFSDPEALRAAAALSCRETPDLVDIGAAEAELMTLVEGRADG